MLRGPTVRCYDNYFLIFLTFSSLFEYPGRLTGHEFDILSNVMEIQQQEG